MILVKKIFISTLTMNNNTRHLTLNAQRYKNILYKQNFYYKKIKTPKATLLTLINLQRSFIFNLSPKAKISNKKNSH